MEKANYHAIFTPFSPYYLQPLTGCAFKVLDADCSVVHIKAGGQWPLDDLVRTGRSSSMVNEDLLAEASEKDPRNNSNGSRVSLGKGCFQ